MLSHALLEHADAQGVATTASKTDAAGSEEGGAGTQPAAFLGSEIDRILGRHQLQHVKKMDAVCLVAGGAAPRRILGVSLLAQSLEAS